LIGLLWTNAGSWLGRRPRRKWAAAPALLGSRLVFQGALYGLTILVARTTELGEFGSFAASFSLAGLLVGGPCNGLGVYVARTTARGTSVELLSVIRTMSVFAAVGITGLGILSIVLTALDPLTAGSCGLFFFSLSIANLVSGLNTAVGRPYLAAVLELSTGLTLMCLVALCAIAGTGIPLLLTIAAVGVLAVTTVVWRSRPSSEPRIYANEERMSLRRLFRRSIPFIAMGSASAGYARLDVALAAIATSSTVVAPYAAASRLLGPVALIGSTFGSLFLPIAVAAGDQDIRGILRRARVSLGAVLIPIAVVLAVAATPLMSLVYGAEYASGASALRILAISVIPYAWYWPGAHLLNSRGREWRWLAILAAVLSVNAILVFILTPQLQAAGIAIAWLITETCTAMLVIWQLRRLPTDRG